MTGDGTSDVLIGVPRSDRAGYRAGAAYLYYGPVDEGEIVDLTNADAVFLGEEARMQAGIDVALANVNGAGTDDVVIGAQPSRLRPDGGATDSPLSRGDFRYIVHCAGDLEGTIDLADVDREER